MRVEIGAHVRLCDCVTEKIVHTPLQNIHLLQLVAWSESIW